PWSGVRRAAPGGAAAAGDARLAVASRDGALLVPLWPLAQALPPMPSAQEELFVLDGGPGPARLVALPAGFAHTDDALWDWLAARFALHDERAADGSASEQTPYVGLATFAPEQAALFVGREREVEGFVNRLRVQPLAGVIGPSGAGKSSFVQ